MKEMVIDAVAVGDRLEMEVEFSLEGRQLEGVSEGTWYNVPLRFGKAYLRKEPSFEGPGGHFLTFDEQQGGYVCWLQMSSDAIHKVSLPLLVPISRVGEQSRCTLEAPSALASTLTIRVDENPAEGTVREPTDETGRPLAFAATPDGHGLFSARGIRGDVSVSWHKSRVAEEQTDVRLDVFGTIIVTADELLQEVRSDGRFVVRGLGGPLERLPGTTPSGHAAPRVTRNPATRSSHSRAKKGRRAAASWWKYVSIARSPARLTFDWWRNCLRTRTIRPGR